MRTHSPKWTQSGTELSLDFRGVGTGENGFAVEISIE